MSKKCTITACVSAEEYDRFWEIARDERMTLSALARELIQWRIAYENGNPLPFPCLEENEIYGPRREAAE